LVNLDGGRIRKSGGGRFADDTKPRRGGRGFPEVSLQVTERGGTTSQPATPRNAKITHTKEKRRFGPKAVGEEEIPPSASGRIRRGKLKEVVDFVLRAWKKGAKRTIDVGIAKRTHQMQSVVGTSRSTREGNGEKKVTANPKQEKKRERKGELEALKNMGGVRCRQTSGVVFTRGAVERGAHGRKGGWEKR